MTTLKMQGGFWTGYREFSFEGGPWKDNPGNRFGVCLLERTSPGKGPLVDAWLPIPDFSVPDNEQEVKACLKAVLRAVLGGQVVYVGCMGGRGRTGLFLALLTKAIGGSPPNIGPVEIVRALFDSHAVETREQEDYVNAFDASDIQVWLAIELFKRRLTAFFPWL
jgi:hypothetical protein